MEDTKLGQRDVPLFNVGKLYITIGAREFLDRLGIDARFFVVRHLTGDFGDIEAEDAATNLSAISDGGVVLSAYNIEAGNPDSRIWVLSELATNPNDNVTTILLPEEY